MKTQKITKNFPENWNKHESRRVFGCPQPMLPLSNYFVLMSSKVIENEITFRFRMIKIIFFN